ncbi:SUR7/PalI family-domain-containing protein [Podospora appendiculata]|uniref:SUR7/PalI family-domain-containing protein n=1 Tax=Podospora appendiculata TaxID=314037 RepID=A0AAE1C9X2_9PEZI|nr:SUR7/PalI family-domain-containing protein [Podospora appendiculata]
MGLPSILRIRKRNTPSSTDSSAPSSRASKEKEERPAAGSLPPSSTTYNAQNANISQAAIKRATRLRRGFAISASCSYLISFVFLILILIGNTYNKPVLNDIYFFKLNLADIIPTSVENASLINSIAQTIGLHDFYQVGLWNFCEGYQDVGITYCSHPKTLYWFNPVEILMNELLSGATIALPTEVVTILDVLRVTSQLMFGFFLTAAVLNLLMIFASPLAVYSRWWSLPIAVLAFVSTLLVVAASVVGSVISFVFKYAAEAQQELNIHADVGVKMFVFMWIATGFALWAFIAHAGMGCCCVSRRDIRTGRREVRNGVVQDQTSPRVG